MFYLYIAGIKLVDKQIVVLYCVNPPPFLVVRQSGNIVLVVFYFREVSIDT